MKRKRKSQMVHMPNDGEAGDENCARCGGRLRDPYPLNDGDAPDQVDAHSTWVYSPKTKTAVGMHYGCSWHTTIQSVFRAYGRPLD